jgi:MFS family permease
VSTGLNPGAVSIVVRVRRGLRGSPFSWLWGAFAISTFGSWLAFDAFSMVAILALHARPVDVSLLAAAGLAVGAVVAVPLGPWVEHRRKRRIMVAMDGARFVALASIPITYAVGRLTFGQLVLAAVVVGTGDICFRAASGSFLKSLVEPGELLRANSRFESTTWTATMIGPPVGGALISAFGPVATVLADAVSYLLSALGITAIPGREQRAAASTPPRSRGEVLEGWRHILAHRALRALFANTLLFNGLVMASAPLIAVLMLGQLGIAPWQYGIAFAAPCVGGLVGSRSARRLAARHGTATVLRWAGTLRACWPVALAFIPPGVAGVVFVAVVQLGLVTTCAVFNPVFATYRLQQTPTDRLARTLAAWTITGKWSIAALTALWGALAALVGVRVAIGAAGLIVLVTPLLLPKRQHLTSSDQSSTLASGDGSYRIPGANVQRTASRRLRGRWIGDQPAQLGAPRVGEPDGPAAADPREPTPVEERRRQRGGKRPRDVVAALSPVDAWPNQRTT